MVAIAERFAPMLRLSLARRGPELVTGTRGTKSPLRLRERCAAGRAIDRREMRNQKRCCLVRRGGGQSAGRATSILFAAQAIDWRPDQIAPVIANRIART